MIKTSFILVVISIIALIESSFGQTEEKHKVCDNSLSDSKIDSLGSCDQYLPKEAKDFRETCLKKMNRGITFKDFRNTVCDETLKIKYSECQHEIFEQNKKEAKTPPKVEEFQNYQKCIKGVLDS